MSELTSDQKGAVAELAIANEAARCGIGVLRPLTDGHPYDLIFEVAAVRCRRIAGGGVSRTTYSTDEVDDVAAYCAELDRCFAVPITKFGESGGLYLRLSEPRNGQKAGLHFADEHRIGAIAQLEERSAGSRQVGGSSPPSSTPSEGTDSATAVGAHEFRNRFGWYMERAAAGEELLVTHRGRPRIRVAPAFAPPFAARAAT